MFYNFGSTVHNACCLPVNLPTAQKFLSKTLCTEIEPNNNVRGKKSNVSDTPTVTKDKVQSDKTSSDNVSKDNVTKDNPNVTKETVAKDTVTKDLPSVSKDSVKKETVADTGAEKLGVVQAAELLANKQG